MSVSDRSASDSFTRFSRFQDDLLTTWRRRFVTIPIICFFAALVWVLSPLWLLLGVLTAPFEKRPFARLRFLLFVSGYLFGEVLFLLLLFLQWLFLLGFLPGSRDRMYRATVSLSNLWGQVLYLLGVYSFDLRLSFEGLDSLEKPGPLIVLSRHASLGDTPLAPTYFGAQYGFRLRYIVKNELKNDPVFDVIGKRLGSCFVRRGSKDSGREIESVCAQLDGLSPNDAVILYPEGTRFSEAKQRQIIEKIHRDNPSLFARVGHLKHVIPPQLGGAIELLARNPGADIVIVQHVGYEVAATFRDLIDGRALHQRIHVGFRRFAYQDLPKPDDREALVTWLLQRWSEMDEWVGERKPEIIPKSAPDIALAEARP
jgi:1-acyl-sn-glycerol-3-phosphate acyltransferase